MGLDLPHPTQAVMLALFSLLLGLLHITNSQHGYGHPPPPPPELYCRDTNTSIYAEVCVPAFAEQVTPVTLAVKEVVDNDYCFDRVLTICEETNTVVQREICTYVYEREDVVTDCQTTQVTYDEKSETMKVTACGVQAPAYGYAADPYHGEHQVCHEEYQTQAYKVPLVTAPLTVQCSLAYPAPKEVCVTKDITITEVKCEDKVENKCFNVAKFVDATHHAVHHAAPVHHAPVYHGKWMNHLSCEALFI